jgi:hypothetical protein
MNIYNCWHQGISGFAAKLDAKRWLFVPDMGQPDCRIRRNIGLSELIFKNRSDYQFELGLQAESRFSLVRTIVMWLFSAEQANTTAGLLLLPQHK